MIWIVQDKKPEESRTYDFLVVRGCSSRLLSRLLRLVLCSLFRVL